LQNRGEEEAARGKGRSCQVVSEQSRGEVELGYWAAWKLGTALEEVGQKRESRPRGVRWAGAGKRK
jgi:hypothetical protein